MAIPTFKIGGITWKETLKRTTTKQLKLRVEARSVEESMVTFLGKNLQQHPGGSRLCVLVYDEKLEIKVDMQRGGFEMNDELANFLIGKPELEVAVETV